jgi:hypothetical protein
MKNATKFFVVFITAMSLMMCKKDAAQFDFANSADRVGIWVNAEKQDTLEFKDHANLIRKGSFYTYQTYTHRLLGDTLFIKLPNTTEETKHVILKKDGTTITLSNMYTTIGFYDNSGLFTKQ